MNPVARRAVLGSLTGLLGLSGMAVLIASGFTPVPPLASTALAAAMLPWVFYAAWRAARSRLSRVAACWVLAIDLAGYALLGLGTGGAVGALACSLVGFGLAWWPGRRSRAPLVRLEER